MASLCHLDLGIRRARGDDPGTLTETGSQFYSVDKESEGDQFSARDSPNRRRKHRGPARHTDLRY